MTREGPIIERLTHRLAATPAVFLKEPRIGAKGLVHVDAVVSDLLQDLGGEPLSERSAADFAQADPKRRNQLRLVLVAAWLFHDEWFRGEKRFAPLVHTCLRESLGALAGLVSADQFVTDPDRREELARLCLEALGLKPGGETDAQAADRLKTLSSVERRKVVAEARAREEHARQVREAMRRKRAAEAAAKVNHE